jgi:hypothetical protein
MKKIKALLMNVMSMLMWNVRTAHAEGEGTGDGTSPAGDESTKKTPTIDFEVLIANARKEEKEKLYPEITKLKTQNEDKTKRVNELLLAIVEKDEALKQKDLRIAELEKGSGKGDSEEVKSLKIKVAELENIVAQKDGEVAKTKLEAFKTVKVSEAGGQLIPELVMGNSEEEIIASIEKSKQRYVEIVGSVKGTVVVTPKDSTQIKPANPNTQMFNEQVNAMDIKGLNMYTPEGRKAYAEMRSKMNLK